MVSVKDIPTIEVLKQQKKWWDINKKMDRQSNPYTYEVLGKKYGNEKVVFRKMEKLVDDGYLEYGVSLRTAWLTEKAERLLTPTDKEGNVNG